MSIRCKISYKERELILSQMQMFIMYINMNTSMSFLQIMKDEINDLFITSIKNDIIKLTSIDSFLVFAV